MRVILARELGVGVWSTTSRGGDRDCLTCLQQARDADTKVKAILAQEWGWGWSMGVGYNFILGEGVGMVFVLCFMAVCSLLLLY